MENQTIIEALLLGLLEGATEFIPVSSTGHILLAGHFLGFQSTGKVFEIVIQLGAILAILGVYFSRLWKMLLDLPRDRLTRHFVLGILIAFLPAAIIGALAHDFIKTVLFESPMLICIMLILGGIVLLFIDRMPLEQRYKDVERFPTRLYLQIGLFQCLAMIPGTSRSGATIVGALLLGVEKRAAAEFSFFLAMPTMAGAVAYDLYKNRDILSGADFPIIATGFVAAFVMAVIVVRFLLDYISRHGYSLFGWWRLIVGGLGLIALLVWGERTLPSPGSRGEGGSARSAETDEGRHQLSNIRAAPHPAPLAFASSPPRPGLCLLSMHSPAVGRRLHTLLQPVIAHDMGDAQPVAQKDAAAPGGLRLPVLLGGAPCLHRRLVAPEGQRQDAVRVGEALEALDR